MNQIELLLRLSENAQDKGDEIAHRYNQERSAHAKELSELLRIIEVAKQNVEAELRRFGVMADKPETHLPKGTQFPPTRAIGDGNAATKRQG